jgi:hypothetical protein
MTMIDGMPYDDRAPIPGASGVVDAGSANQRFRGRHLKHQQSNSEHSDQQAFHGVTSPHSKAQRRAAQKVRPVAINRA